MFSLDWIVYIELQCLLFCLVAILHQGIGSPGFDGSDHLHFASDVLSGFRGHVPIDSLPWTFHIYLGSNIQQSLVPSRESIGIPVGHLQYRRPGRKGDFHVFSSPRLSGPDDKESDFRTNGTVLSGLFSSNEIRRERNCNVGAACRSVYGNDFELEHAGKYKIGGWAS